MLIRTAGADRRVLVRSGARATPRGWSVPRSVEVDLDALDEHLPRYARRTVVPEVVDLIPSSSWNASLANMLLPKAWATIRTVANALAEGCVDCGASDRLECHEDWSYDERAGVQTLRGLLSLCGRCHETRHLGFARVRGRYDKALSRLGMLNRLGKGELSAFADETFERFERRSRRLWKLDLSFLAGHGLGLKRGYALTSPGIVEDGRTSAAIVGVSLERGPKGVVIA